MSKIRIMNYELRIKNIKKNKKGTALFMTLMILSSVLIISLGAASLIISGLKQGRTQTHSTRAYFAAEAGAERVLWEIRKNLFVPSACTAGTDYIVFDNDNSPPNTAACGAKQTNTLSNNASYFVFYKLSSPVTLEIIGEYSDVRRSVQLSY